MTIILDNFPPSTLQGVGLGGRKNPRIIVGENYCHFGASYEPDFFFANRVSFFCESIRADRLARIAPIRVANRRAI